MKTKQQFFEWVGITAWEWRRSLHPKREQEFRICAIKGEQFQILCDIDASDVNGGIRVANRNANLMIQSPEMLWALVMAIEKDQPHCPICGCFQNGKIDHFDNCLGVKSVESATNKKWSEIVEFLEGE